MKAIKLIATRSEQSFSLGLDSITLSHLKELQATPEFTLRDNKTPSRTLVTRQALRHFSKTVSQAKISGDKEWLLKQNNALQQLAQQGRKDC